MLFIILKNSSYSSIIEEWADFVFVNCDSQIEFDSLFRNPEFGTDSFHFTSNYEIMNLDIFLNENSQNKRYQ